MLRKLTAGIIVTQEDVEVVVSHIIDQAGMKESERTRARFPYMGHVAAII